MEGYLTAVAIVMNIWIIIGNSFLLLVVLCNWRTIQLQCRNRASVLLTVNLCAADLFLGVVSIYYFLSLYLPLLLTFLAWNKIPCIVTFPVMVMTYMASGFNLVAIAAERYIYIVHALRHAEMCNTRRTLYMISGVWLTSFWGTFPLYFWNNWQDGVENVCDDVTIIPTTYSLIATTSRVILIAIFITVFHWKIHRESLKVQNRRGPMNGITTLRTRSARIVFIISSAFFISSTPFMVMLLCEKYHVYVPPICFQVSRCLYNLNYVLNSFIYAFHNRVIRYTIFKTLGKWKRKLNLIHSVRKFRRKSQQDSVISNTTLITTDTEACSPSGRCTYTNTAVI